MNKRFAIIVITLFLLVFLGRELSSYIQTQPYASFVRPDGKYWITVQRMPTWLALMPGQSGDVPGKVQLFDQHGKLLYETEVEMVQLISEVEWIDQTARIKFVAEWKLPD